MAFPTIIDASNNSNDATVYNSTSGSIIEDTSSTNRISNMLKKPYLVWQLDETTMKINWQAASTMPCALSWGTDTTYSVGRVITTETGVAETEHQHSYLITNLTPGTLYYYKVEENIGGVYYSQFRTPDNSAAEVKIFAIGDTQGYPPTHLNEICNNIITKLSDPLYQFLFHVGDWSDTDSEANLKATFFDSDFLYANQARSSVPFIGVKGNHDNTDLGVVYNKYWDFNYVSPFYYKFDNGPVSHFIVDLYSSYTSGSAQYTWLSNSLSASTKPWKIVWIHEPMYSEDGGHGPDLTVRAALEGLFRNTGVALVMSGHQHFYARCQANNITHLSIGGAGAALYTIQGTGTGLVLSSQNHHYVELDITASAINCVVYKGDDNTVLDSFSISTPPSTSTSTTTTTGTTTTGTTTTTTTGTTTTGTTITGTTTTTITTTTGTTGTTTTLAYSEIYSTYFDGTTQYGMVSDSRSLDFGRNAFGISFWLHANTETLTIQALISKINDIASITGGKGWSIYINTSGKLCIKVSDTIDGALTEYSINDVNYRDNAWHHVVVNYDFTSSTASYFIDAVAQTSDVTTAFDGNFDSTYPLMVAIGWNKGATKDIPYAGYLDEVSIHNSPIDQTRATQLYNDGTPIDLSGDSTVMSWWRMGDGDTFPYITDRGLNSNTITLYNMASGSIAAVVPLSTGTTTTTTTTTGTTTTGTTEITTTTTTGTTTTTTGTTEITTTITTTTTTTTTTGTTNTTTTLAFNEIYSTYFDGVTQYGMAPDSRSLDFGRNAFGISFWVKITSGSATYQAIISKISDFYSGTGGAGWSVYLHNGSFCIRVSDTNGGILTEYSINATDYRDDLWHHVVVNYDFTSSTASYFIDAVAQTSDVTTAFAGNFDTTYPLMFAIGWNKGATKDYPFKGHLDEVSIHNSPIDQTRATQLYNGGTPIDLSGDSTVMSWWRMGDGDTFPSLTDRGLNSNTVTLYNMASGSIVTDVP